MNPFHEDIRAGREENLSIVRQTLAQIGDESRHHRTLPDRRALAVLEALKHFDRKTLPVQEIARLVDVETQRIYQIEKDDKDRLTSEE